MTIVYHRGFVKDFKKLPVKIKEKAEKRLILFDRDEFDPILNNHPLKGKHQGFRSINVTGNLRAIYKKEAQDTIIFVAIDSHSNLYG